MWAAVIILAQVFGPPQPGGQQDLDLCTGKTKSSREESIPACHRVVSKEVLDKKSIGKAYLLLARWADQPAGAISYLDQAIAQDPENGDYYGERGFQYHLLSDYDRALSEYEKGLALKSDSSYTHFVRALTFARKGEDARALADLDEAITIEPKHPEYYTNKAEIYLRQGATSEALAALDQGLKVKTDHANSYNVKAEVYRKLGDSDGELAALARLIALEPKLQRGLFQRALLYERLGRFDLAISDYDALLALDPDGNFYRERRAALLKSREESAPPPVPAVVVGDAPGKNKETSRGEAPLKKADRNAAALECRVYVPGANLTVAVPCAK
jgi:tetratricopeptide (TPR) repeat protein